MQNINGQEKPKVFISYSWHPESDKQKVYQIAERLTNDGVYVVLDVWDLKEGQDKNAYMEKMVSDPTVDKVLIFCNSEYEKKANQRKGGVGIEGTIVSSEVYNKTEQTKFIPVILEYKDGKACLPVFLKQVYSIDFSNPESYEENYDQLLRTIYNKPVYKRPPIGDMPERLNEEVSYLATAGMVESIHHALLTNSSNPALLIKDYQNKFFTTLLAYKLDYREFNNSNFIQAIEDSIAKIIALRNDFIEFVKTTIDSDFFTSDFLVKFFERLLQTYSDSEIDLDTGEDAKSVSFDNYRYFNYDLFLSLAALLIENERFDILGALVRAPFFIEGTGYRSDTKRYYFGRFNQYNYTLEYYKNNRNGNNLYTVVGVKLKDNATNISIRSIVRADILLSYASLIFPGDDTYQSRWFPYTSLYNSQVEILPRLISRKYFEKFKTFFNVKTVEEYKSLIGGIEQPRNDTHWARIPQIDKGLLVESVATKE